MEALGLLLQSDALNPRAGPAGQSGYLETRRRMQTACYWQFLFPIVLRELGTRHDFPRKMQSRRIRCAPFPLQFTIESGSYPEIILTQCPDRAYCQKPALSKAKSSLLF